MACSPSLTVKVPPVLSLFAEYPSVVLVPKLMFDRSDAFVALPGGIGTLEELVEQLTWAQLGRHTKPIVLLNVAGFWEPFLALLRHMSDEVFIRPDMQVRFSAVERAEDVVPAILTAAAQPRREPAAAASVSDKF